MTRQLLKENTWGRLRKAFPEIFIRRNESEKHMRVRCVIPLCIGYSEKALVSFDSLNAWLEGIAKKGFSYYIFKDPKDSLSLEQWEADFAKWKKEKVNQQSLLSNLPANHFQSMKQVREEACWDTAFKIIEKINENSSFNEKLAQDVSGFRSRHPEINSDDSTAHFINTAADYLSFMQSAENWEKEKEITVLFYDHGLSKTMEYVDENASSYNYKSESVVHVKPKCKECKVANDPSAFEENFSKLVKIVFDSEVPIEYGGRMIYHAFMEGITDQSQSTSYSLINERLKNASTTSEKKNSEAISLKPSVPKEIEKKKAELPTENIVKNSLFNNNLNAKEEKKDKKEELKQLPAP